MSEEKLSLMDILRRRFRARVTVSGIAVSRYPKSWHAQTDYNPVPPGAGRPETIDMRPKAVEEREKQARNSLIVPLVTIGGVVLVLVIAVLIKVGF